MLGIQMKPLMVETDGAAAAQRHSMLVYLRLSVGWLSTIGAMPVSSLKRDVSGTRLESRRPGPGRQVCGRTRTRFHRGSGGDDSGDVVTETGSDRQCWIVPGLTVSGHGLPVCYGRGSARSGRWETKPEGPLMVAGAWQSASSGAS